MEAKYGKLTNKLEQQLKESEEKFRIITQQSIIGIGILQDNTLKYINEGASKINEYSIQEMQNWNITNIAGMIHPEDLSFAIEQARKKQIGVKDVVNNYEYRIITKSGKVKWIDQYSKTILYGGKPADLSIWIDITEKKKTEEMIRNTQTELATIFNVAGNGIRVIDKNFNVLRMNQAFIELTGGNKTELEKQKCYEQFPHPKCHTNECTLNCIIEGDECVDIEVIKRRHDGKKIVCNLVATPFRNAAGELLGIVEVFKDITEHKQAEELLLKSERFLSNVFSSIQDGICIIDKDYTILRINATMEKWYPHMIPIRGKKCYQVYQHRNEPCEDCLCAKIYETNEPILKTIFRKGSKAEILGILEIYTFPLFDQETGIVNGVIEYVRDVTERKLAEQKLKESEEKYRSTLENIKEGYFEVDLKGNFIFCNDAFYKLVKLPKEELIGKNFSHFISIKHPENVFQSFNNIFKTESPLNRIEIEVKSRNGKKTIIESSAYIKYDSKGDKIGFYGLIRDITEQKLAEEMIEQEIEKLKELDRIKTDFIHRTSHELRTPLVSISSAAQILLELSKGKIDNRTESLMQIINNGGKRLEFLIDNLLDISRIESNKLELTKRRENIVRIIIECINELKYVAEKRNIRITHDIPKHFYIKIDYFRIRQVIMNILLNAIKNTPHYGSISINLEKQKNFITIKINDSGVGFTKKEKKLIFKKFGKIERYGKGMDINTEGSGLGLYISKEIVNEHNGTIWVESKGRNKGSSFNIRLPVK